MIPKTYINELLERANIVELIGNEIPLTKQGKNYLSTCPFHRANTVKREERSFTVAPVKNFYHCFGCGAHGTIINFYMEYKCLKFTEAIELIAEKVGLPVPVLNPASESRRSQTTAISQDLGVVLSFYKDALKKAPDAIAFLKSRGISGKTAKKYEIGYAPNGWNNLEPLFGSDYADKCLTCGIAAKNDKQRLDDIGKPLR